VPRPTRIRGNPPSLVCIREVSGLWNHLYQHHCDRVTYTRDTGPGSGLQGAGRDAGGRVFHAIARAAGANRILYSRCLASGGFFPPTLKAINFKS
jgi:hypothetical protein